MHPGLAIIPPLCGLLLLSGCQNSRATAEPQPVDQPQAQAQPQSQDQPTQPEPAQPEGVAPARADVQDAGPAAPTHGAPPPPVPAAAPPRAVAPMAATPDGIRLSVLHSIRQDSGLIIDDLRMGTGADCLPNSVITVRYHGTLVNGVVFDTTRGKGPAEFPLDRLIRGWREGLPGMKVGGIRRLTIPAALAYGDKQKGIIPPNSDLIFSIELLGVK